MCCGHEQHYRGRHWHRHHGGFCGCSGFHGSAFLSKAEKIAWLEEYAESLQAEVESIKERITALKGEE